MRIFANNKIWKKIVIIIGILLSFSIVVPEPVEADLGGKLMQPIMSLFIGIGDGVNTVIQKMFLNREPAVLIISSGFNWWKVALGVAIGIGLIAVGIATGGVGTIIIGSALTIAVLATAVTGGNSSSENIAFQVVTSFTASMLSDKNELALPMMSLTPYEIFANKQNLFSVNFFKKNLSEDEKYIKGSDDEENKEGKKEKSKTLMYSLQDIIASWYKTFRLIAIVGMLPVLVYIGIRILVSAPSDKAKYKENLMDWGVAFLLIFAMHYIMSSSNLFIDQVTDMIDSVKISTKMGGEKEVEFKNQSVEGFLIGVKGEGEDAEIDDDTTELVRTAHEKMITGESATETTKKYAWCFWTDLSGTQANIKGEENAKVLFWPCDNFVAQSRMYAQRAKGDFAYIGYGLIYVILTIYTCVFIFVYLRRFMYMAFLTLVAPLVALTYPIDKIRDGKAQAFEFWFKEYFYNLLLQPLHLLLYLILVGSAMSFAAKNPIYVCVILGFMTPFEKLLKQMFGFRGETPGSLPGMATGALMMEASHRIFGKPPKGMGGDNGSNSSGTSQDEQRPKPIRQTPIDTSGANLPSGNNNNSQGQMTGTSRNNGQIGSGELENKQIGYGQIGNGQIGSGETGNGQIGDGQINDDQVSREQIENSNNNLSGEALSSSTNDVKENKNRRLPRRILGYVGNAAKYTGRATGNYFRYNGKRIAKDGAKSVLKTAGKVAGGVAVGSAAAMGGMLAGVVSGDPSKALSYATAGGVAGYKLGSKGAENVGKTISGTVGSQIDSIRNEYYRDNPDKYIEKEMKKYRNNWKRNENNDRTLRKNLSTQQYQNLMKGAEADDPSSAPAIDKYLDAGFDAKQIVAAEKIRDDYNFSQEQAMTVAKMTDKYYEGATGVDSEKYKKKMRENLIENTPEMQLQEPKVPKKPEEPKMPELNKNATIKEKEYYDKEKEAYEKNKEAYGKEIESYNKENASYKERKEAYDKRKKERDEVVDAQVKQSIKYMKNYKNYHDNII